MKAKWTLEKWAVSLWVVMALTIAYMNEAYAFDRKAQDAELFDDVRVGDGKSGDVQMDSGIRKTSSPRVARFHLIPPKKHYRLSVGYEYGFTDENYNHNGLREEIRLGETSSAELTQHSLKSSAIYSLSDRLATYAELDYRYLDGYARKTSTNQSGETYSFGDLTMGAKTSILGSNSKNELTLFGAVEVPLYDAGSYSRAKDLIPGDGSVNVLAGLETRIPFGEWAAVASLAYRYKSEDFANELPYSLEVRREMGSFLVGAAALGKFSLKGDAGTTFAISDWLPSNRYNAKNPSRHGARLWIGKGFGSKVLGQTYFEFPYAGENSWAGWQAGLNITIAPSSGKDEPAISDRPQSFREFSLIAKVIKVSSKQNFLRVNKGQKDGVFQGDRFEVYADREGFQRAIATGRIVRAKENYAVLKITRFFQKALILKGMNAKKVLTAPR